MIKDYGDIDGLIKNVDKIKQEKRRESIKENRELAILSKKLVTLKDDVPLPLPIDTLSYRPLEVKELIKMNK